MKKLAILLVVAAACGKSDKKSSAPPSAPIDVAAVNALVPAELKDKLVFEKRDITEERGKRSTVTYTMAAPKDWEQDMKMFASVKPKSEANLGFMTSLQVGSNCDGTCEPKDWAKTSEKVNFAQFRDGGKIVKDDLQKTSHLMITEKGDSTYVVYAWWSDGAKRYFSCTASLEQEVKAAADAFAKACQAVNMAGDLN
ncbi:MAG TPA: hypothetical protein VFV99_30590 [Kofleriaceae bacterium]|nr:hypothetical protein [Kofleriaceae bacterium]